MRYRVTLTPDDGSYVVTFPDVPEAITYGDTAAEALSRAPDALLTIFDAFIKDRRDIPEPSPVSDGPCVELPALETAKIALYREMRAKQIGKAELAKRLKWHLPQVDRVLNVRHGSQLDQLEAAFSVLGKRLVVGMEDLVSAPGGQLVGSAVVRKMRHRVIRRRPIHGAIRAKASQTTYRTNAPLGRTSTPRIATKRAAKKR